MCQVSSIQVRGHTHVVCAHVPYAVSCVCHGTPMFRGHARAQRIPPCVSQASATHLTVSLCNRVCPCACARNRPEPATQLSACSSPQLCCAPTALSPWPLVPFPCGAKTLWAVWWKRCGPGYRLSRRRLSKGYARSARRQRGPSRLEMSVCERKHMAPIQAMCTTVFHDFVSLRGAVVKNM